MRALRLDTLSAREQLVASELMLATGKEESVANWFEYIRRHLIPNFFNPLQQATFEPTFIDRLAEFSLECVNHPHDRLRNTTIDMWLHIGTVLATLNPQLWLESLTTIANSAMYADYLWVVVPSVGEALAVLRKEQQIKHWPLVNKLVLSLSVERLAQVKSSIWDLFAAHSTPQNLQAILTKIGKTQPFHDVWAKLAGARKEAMDKLLEGFDLPFILAIVHKMETSKRPDIAKIGPVLRPFCLDERNSQADVAITAMRLCLLKKSVVSESDRELLMPVVAAAKQAVEKDNHPSQFLDFLRTAASRNLLPREELVNLMALGSRHVSCRMTSVKIFADNCELAMKKENAKEELLVIASTHETDAYKQLIPLVSTIFSKAVEIDEDFAFKLVKTVLIPYPRDPQKVGQAVRMLNALPSTALADPRIGVNFQHLFDTFAMTDRQTIIDGFAKLRKRVDIHVDYAQFDLFGSYAPATYQYLTDMDELLLKEILETRIVEPAVLRHILKVIAQKQARGHIFYVHLINLLQFLCMELGVGVQRAFSEVSLPFDKAVYEHPWISEVDMHAMVENITSDFRKSEFILLFKATLEALGALYDYDDTQKEHYMKLAVMCSMIVDLFPGEACRILLKFVETTKRHQGAALKQTLAKVMERVNQQNPLSCYTDYVYLLIAATDFKDVYQRKKEYVELAASVDREFAQKHAKDLVQPLPIMNTFLSFVRIKEHEGWVDVCQHTIPPEEWIYEPSDINLIKSLPNSQGAEAIHQAAIDICQASHERSLKTSNQGVSTAVPPRSFQFQDVVVETIDVKIRETEPATIANLVSWLWHVGRELPDGFTPEKLEEIAYAHPSHAKLLTGFFLWSKFHNYTIDVEKWAQRISITESSKYATLAFAAFFAHVKGKFLELSTPVKDVMRLALEISGKAGISKIAIIGMFRSATGPRWLLARNLILIDPTFWDDFPVVRAVAMHDIDAFKDYLNNKQSEPSFNFELYWGLSQLCLQLNSSDMLIDEWPICYESLPQMMAMRPESYLPAPRKIDVEILGSTFAAWQKGKNLPYDQLNMFYSMDLDQSQIASLEKVLRFDKSADVLKYFIPGLFDFGGRAGLYNFNDALHKDVSAFFEYKPPSLTRRYVRSALLVFKRRMSQSFESILMKEAFTEVHPALLYSQTAHMGVRTWPNASGLSLLRYGIFSEPIYKELTHILTLHSMEAVNAAFLLTSLNDDYLKAAVPLGNVAMAREEILRHIVNAIASEDADLWHAIQIIHLLLMLLKPDDVLMLICNKVFVNQPNFLCAYLVFRFFERSLNSETTKDFAEFCQVFHDPESGMFSDPRKAEVFAKSANAESVALALHVIPVGEKPEE